jgi:hypothetical protein
MQGLHKDFWKKKKKMKNAMRRYLVPSREESGFLEQ